MKHSHCRWEPGFPTCHQQRRFSQVGDAAILTEQHTISSSLPALAKSDRTRAAQGGQRRWRGDFSVARERDGARTGEKPRACGPACNGTRCELKLDSQARIAEKTLGSVVRGALAGAVGRREVGEPGGSLPSRALPRPRENPEPHARPREKTESKSVREQCALTFVPKTPLCS